MDYTWMFYKDHENVNALLTFWEDKILENPEELIRQIEGEMNASLVHEGNVLNVCALSKCVIR